MATPVTSKVLMVVLRGKPLLRPVDQLPNGEVTVDGIQFREKDSNDFTGFYDWLRNRAGVIVGVRYLPHDEYGEVLERAMRLPYVVPVCDGKGVEIFFGENRDYDPTSSDDQDFGKNKILYSASGECLLTFDTKLGDPTSQ